MRLHFMHSLMSSISFLLPLSSILLPFSPFLLCKPIVSFPKRFRIWKTVSDSSHYVTDPVQRLKQKRLCLSSKTSSLNLIARKQVQFLNGFIMVHHLAIDKFLGQLSCLTFTVIKILGQQSQLPALPIINIVTEIYLFTQNPTFRIYLNTQF